MYRLLNSRFSNLSSIQKSLLDLRIKPESPHKTNIRLLPTKTNPNESQTKQNKLKNKKYYDLVVVTNNESNEANTFIQKLTSNDLSILASTNLNLSELYKLKKVTQSNEFIEEYSYNNLNVLPDLGKTAPSKETERVISIANVPIEPYDVPHELEEEAEEEEIEMDPIEEKTVKHDIAAKTLASYMEICSNLKVPQKGLNALFFHNMRASGKSKKNFVPMKNVRVFNAILKGFAAQSDDRKLEEVLTLMHKDNVKFNAQTYVSILECYGRLNNAKKIHHYVNEAKKDGFTFDKLINCGSFLNDERNVVLKALRVVVPNYKPVYFKPLLQYNNHLVDGLNDRMQFSEPKLKLGTSQGIFTKKDLNEAINRQVELEKQGMVTVRSIEAKQDKITEEVLKYRQVLNQHLSHWQETAHKAYNRDLQSLIAHRSPLNDEPYMRCIPIKDYVAIIIDEAKKLAQGSETFSLTVNQLHRELGSKVYARYRMLRKEKTGVLEKTLNIHRNYCELYANLHEKLDVLPKQQENCYNSRQLWQWNEYKLADRGATLDMDHREWSPSILQTIGKFLYHIVMHDLQVDVNAMQLNSKHKNYFPAFYTIFRNEGHLVKEEVKPHPVLSRLYRASMPETLTFPTCELPMLCPPIPWTCVYTGGFIISPCDLVRLPNQATSQKYRLRKSDPVQLYPSLDSLNQLSCVAWKVNTKILDIILEVFNSGGSTKLDVPECPDSLQPPQLIGGDKFKLFKQKLQFRRKRAEMYSLWCDCLYRLSLANHYRKEIFWLPHNMDFRGRVYPIPPHLNHLGSDLARSMLIFAERRPLGPNGLNWLKIHLINLTGLKKHESLNHRLEYANEIMDRIMDSADRPLTGLKWWMDSDEPWQSLACCIEIANAIRFAEKPNNRIEDYLCGFPVHQDGSCNGLQHYAALGRDSVGAFSVNLCPCEKPQDVYSAVVDLVELQRRQDALNGLEVAKLLEGYVKRKVIKQTIMTTVYGVTRFGARLQIAKQLKDIDNFPKDQVWAASSYLTMRTFDSLRSMFKSTREIQDWFTDCAKLISTVSGQHVEWQTPMGLPIVQPYIKYKSLGTSQVYKPFRMDQYEKPNVMKQKNAFPPNFVHSLDSSHMMLTSLYCERAGITFVSVHDCYWTHPSTVEIMNKICREQFVALHSEPILENLSMFFSEKYSYNKITNDGTVSDLAKKKLNRILRQLPKTGDFDIKSVLESVYFFS